MSAQEPLVREVAATIRKGVYKDDFQTGHEFFNAEWAFGTYQMAGLGLAQFLNIHPEASQKYLPVVEECIVRLKSQEMRSFDSNSWGEDPLESLDKDRGHAAYLGYFNLVLGLYRAAGGSRFGQLHARITHTLVRRVKRSRPLGGLIETYPGQVFPVDNGAVIGSIALYDECTGEDHTRLISSWTATCRRRWVAPGSGLLFQAVHPTSGKPLDKPRSSGTALAVYFLSFADMELSRDLYMSLKEQCGVDILGFGAVKEYPPTVAAGSGDIDSGPIVFGLGFSATGFSIAGSRIHEDRAFFKRLYRTAYLIGAPYDKKGRRSFVCGGPLGNAILLAMLTAGGER